MLGSVAVMSAGWQAVFFAIAVLLFLASSLRSRMPNIHSQVDLLPLGLASFGFVFFWNALARV